MAEGPVYIFARAGEGIRRFAQPQKQQRALVPRYQPRPTVIPLARLVAQLYAIPPGLQVHVPSWDGRRG